MLIIRTKITVDFSCSQNKNMIAFLTVWIKQGRGTGRSVDKTGRLGAGSYCKNALMYMAFGF